MLDVLINRMGKAVRCLVLAVGLASLPTLSLADAAPIIIGVVTAQSGALASYDQPSLAGFRLAIDDINKRGGLGGKYKVKLVVKDTRSDMAVTIAAAQELVDAGAKIMITPCDADPSIVVGQITQSLGIPTLTFCGSSPILTGAVGDMMFATYPTDNLQASALASYATEQQLRKAYLLVSPDSTYTAKLPEYFAQAFTRKGGKVIGRSSFAMNQQDFSAVVTKIKNLREPPDLIMTAAYEPDFPAFIRQLRAAGVMTPVFGADALGTPTVLGLGKLVDGVVFTAAGCAAPGSRLEAFNERFKQVTGRAPQSTYEVNGYEIGLILDAAAKNAASSSGKAIRDALASLKNFQGITSTITYAGTQRMPLRSIAVLRHENGARHCAKVITPAAADIPPP
jgi:branched-chain amino acid transport system substrate-binding protein